MTQSDDAVGEIDGVAQNAGANASYKRVARACGALVRRHPLGFVVLIAFAARAGVATYVALAHGGSLFLDDETYADMAREMAAGETENWSDYRRWLYSYTATFLVPLTAVYKVVGPAPLPGQLLVATAGTGTAALVYFLIRRALPPGYAVAGALVVGVLPSQVLWSSLTLKDAFIWAVAAGLAVAVALLEGAGPRRLAAIVIGWSFLLVCLESLRPHTFVIALYALVIVCWMLPGPLRAQRGLAATLLAVLLPLATGHGVAGRDLVFGISPAEQRLATAQVDDDTTLSEGEVSKPDLAYLPRGLMIMLLEPFPWQRTGNTRLELAKIEHLGWYPLLALAVLGLRHLRRSPYLMLFPLVFGLGTLTVFALVEANLGTAYRHRGELVWPVATLASSGLSVVRRRMGAPPIYGGQL